MAAERIQKISILQLDPTSERSYVARDPITQVLERKLYLDILTYDDLGAPDTITLTIEPGDTLNR